MRHIFASSSPAHLKLLGSISIYDWLISYFYLRTGKFGRRMSYTEAVQRLEWVPEGHFFVLDSGAFSAWKQKEIIDLFEYIDVVKEIEHLFSHTIALDVIDDPITSEAHTQIMVEEGCSKVVPVFHSGEPWHVLRYLIDQEYPAIGLSPNNDWAEKDKILWMRDVFSLFPELASIHTHSFGWGSINTIRFPITTADSLAWLLEGAFGCVITDKGKFRVTDRRPTTSTRRHIRSCSADFKEQLGSIVDSLGLTFRELQEDAKARMCFNASYMYNLFAKAGSPVPIFYPKLLDVSLSTSDFNVRVQERKEDTRSGNYKPQDIPSSRRLGYSDRGSRAVALKAKLESEVGLF